MKAICLQRIAGDQRIEGDVIFSRYGNEVYAQRGADPPQRILEHVAEFDSDGSRVAYVDGQSVRLLELDANLERVSDTRIAEAPGARAVAIDGGVIAWISDEGVSVAKGVPGEEVKTAAGYVVWGERVGSGDVLHAWRGDALRLL